MESHIIKVLAEEKQTSELADLTKRVKDLLKLSRDEMAKHYDRWDRNEEVYRGERSPDQADAKAAARGEPVKMVVPLTYQQVQTFVSFVYQVFTQRQYFFELDGVGIEDSRAANLAQAVLQRDLNYNKYISGGLVQFLTDIAKFGLGVVEHSWTHDTLPVIQMVPDPKWVPVPGVNMQPPMIRQVTRATKFKGNKISTVSPYRFYPDPRLPLTKFAEGEFVGSFDEMSREDLKAMERKGECAGVEFVPKWTSGKDLDNRRQVLSSAQALTRKMSPVDDRYVIVDKIQLKLNPAQTEIAPGVVLDKDIDEEVKYLIWIANDNRIIRMELLSYAHGDFTYDIAQFSEDQARFLNFGLAELLSMLQDTITWFVNARITSVRKVIDNRFVIDPDAIEFSDFANRSPVIRLKKKYAGGGIDQYIKQLQVSDVTANHLGDVNFLSEWARDTTGITENLMGSFAPGRRSAQEAKNVANNSAARLLLIAHSIWDSAQAPLGRKLLSNLRQGLDEQTLIQLQGTENAAMDPQSRSNFIMLDPTQLAGNYDFIVFDGTQPGQRAFTAQALQELVLAMAKDPRLIPVLNYDPQVLVREILNLRNVRNTERFQLTPQRTLQLQQLAQPPGNGMGVPGAGPQAPAGGPGNPPQAPGR